MTGTKLYKYPHSSLLQTPVEYRTSASSTTLQAFTMFSKLAVVTSLAILAAATPMPNVPASQCTTGPIQCCNSVQKASDPSVSKLLGLLGIVVQDVTALVGVTCSPISVSYRTRLLRTSFTLLNRLCHAGHWRWR